MSLTLVIGGTSSGKSAHAEALAALAPGPVRYVATADPADRSMHARIERHQSRRPGTWETVIAGEDLTGCLAIDGLTLIDGLGVWIATHYTADHEAEITRLLAAAATRQVIVVAEEAGQGLLPLDRVSRDWLDTLGRVTQALSAAAERVDYVVAGRVIPLPAGPRSPRMPPGTTAPAASDAQTALLAHHGDQDVLPGEHDHAVNVLAGGPPHWLADCLASELTGSATRYPDERPAVAALAAMHHRDPAEVVITNGATEALWLLGRALGANSATIIGPAFSETELGLSAARVSLHHALRDPDAGFALDKGTMLDRSAIPDAGTAPLPGQLIVATNPASPDGTLYGRDDLLALRAPGQTLVIDEAFMAMVPGEPQSLADRSLADVIVIRSLTKILSVPGLRVGYLLAPPPLAAALRAARPPWSANALALAAIVAASRHTAGLGELARRSAAEGKDLQKRLGALDDLRTWPSLTNYTLIQTEHAPELRAALKARGFVVRSGAGFRGLDETYLRITARAPEQNATLVTVIQELLAK